MLNIIVPYRNRSEHLALFVPYMQAWLRGHDIAYKMLVIEQAGTGLFNRGKLLNVGFDIAEKQPQNALNYYIFHDVDMVPVVADYSPADAPTCLITDATQFAEGLPYEHYFGGVTLFPRADFVRVNGFSNGYWGWGSEDDDILQRLGRMGITAKRREIGIFESMEHEHATQNKDILKAAQDNNARLLSAPDLTTDGLTTLEYSIINETITNNVYYYTVTI